MEKKQILVVDDEQDLCDILLFNLRSAGYDARAAYSAEEALQQMAGGWQPDLLLLDVMMPGMSGFELAERLKGDGATGQVPIIFLTAKDTEDDMLQGFRLGADDYVRKPFSVREVLARVKAVLFRSATQPAGGQETVGHEGLTMNLRQKTVSMDGQEVSLTKTEFGLLSQLLIHCGRVLTRQELLEAVWPKDVIVTDRTVDVNIARLRKKLGRYANNVVARQGYGYMFEA